MRKAVEKLIEIVKSDKEILAVFLFGSAAREEGTEGSDIDICLIMNKGLYAADVLFQKRLNYLQKFDLDIQIFQQLPLYIRMRIIKEGKLLFCRDEDSMYEIAFKVIREFGDFESIYRDYLEEVAHAG